MRLRSDVPIGTALSGGIDSSTVAAFVSEINLKKNISIKSQTGFNLSFPGSFMDENLATKKIARKLGINLETITIEPNTLSNSLEKVCYLFEDIQEVNPLPHYFLYKSMKQKGFSVSLDGHGGDELFCGYESSILHAFLDSFYNFKSLKEVYNTYTDVHPKNNYFEKMSLKRIPLYLAKEYLSYRRLKNRGKLEKNFF